MKRFYFFWLCSLMMGFSSVLFYHRWGYIPIQEGIYNQGTVALERTRYVWYRTSSVAMTGRNNIYMVLVSTAPARSKINGKKI